MSTAATRRVQFYGALFFNNYRFPRSRNSWPFSGPNIGASFGAGASARQLPSFGACRCTLAKCSGRKMGCLFGVVFLEKQVRRCIFAMFSWLTGGSSEREGLIRKATWGSHVPEMISSPEVCKVTFRLQAEQHLQVTLLSLVLLSVREWKSECFVFVRLLGWVLVFCVPMFLIGSHFLDFYWNAFPI